MNPCKPAKSLNVAKYLGLNCGRGVGYTYNELFSNAVSRKDYTLIVSVGKYSIYLIVPCILGAYVNSSIISDFIQYTYPRIRKSNLIIKKTCLVLRC